MKRSSQPWWHGEHQFRIDHGKHGEQRRVHDECLFVGVLFRDNAAAVRFHLFRTMAADTGVQYDSDALDECISMLTVMNRLMYRQMSELFNTWEETEGHGQFYDENLEAVDKVSEGFGLLGLAVCREFAMFVTDTGGWT